MKYINIIKDDFIYYLTDANGLFHRKIEIGELAAPLDPLDVFKYVGTSLIRLAARQESDPRWLTEEQCAKAGYIIKPAAKSVKVICPVLVSSGIQQNITIDVYNAAGIKGIQPFNKSEIAKNDLQNKIEKMITNSDKHFIFLDSHKIEHKHAMREDAIYMLGKSEFASLSDFYATAVYELAKAKSSQFYKAADDSLRNPKVVFSATIACYMFAAETGVSALPLKNKEVTGKIIGMINENPIQIIKACVLAGYIKEALINRFNYRAISTELKKQRQHNRDAGSLEY